MRFDTALMSNLQTKIHLIIKLASVARLNLQFVILILTNSPYRKILLAY